MSKVKIITDSGSDIKREIAEELGIRLIPISYTFDGENYYREGIDEPGTEFYKKLRESGQIPKTTQITPIQYEEIFNEEYDNGNDNLIVITISSNGSGIFQNATLTAQQLMEERGGSITVVDSSGFSCLYGVGAIQAAKMSRAGKSKEEIVEFLNDLFPSLHAYFLVGDLEHLKKGGRINAATLVVANLLDIKPVLTVKDGVVIQHDKIRGSKRVWKKLIDIAKDSGHNPFGGVLTVHTEQPEKENEIREELTKEYDDIKAGTWDVGAVIACHGGPDLVGFVYSDKYNVLDLIG